MSWDTRTEATIIFNRCTYNTKDEVYSRLDDVKMELDGCEGRIRLLIAGQPRDLLNCKDCEGYEMDPVDVVKNRTDELLEWYNDLIIERYKLNLLLENFDKRTGDFIRTEDSDPNQTSLEF